MCVWDCCGCYIKLAEFLSFIVFDPFVDLFITLCIVINTAFMALDHHDMDPTMTSTLKNGNYVRDFLYFRQKKIKVQKDQLNHLSDIFTIIEFKSNLEYWAEQ